MDNYVGRRKSYATPVEITVNEEVSVGFAHFDVESYFPCFVLFLDNKHALIIRQAAMTSIYKRIGVASFNLTPSQNVKRREKVHLTGAYQDWDAYGPITDRDSRVIVTII